MNFKTGSDSFISGVFLFKIISRGAPTIISDQWMKMRWKFNGILAISMHFHRYEFWDPTTFENHFFWKPQVLIFFIFFQNRVTKKMEQKVFGSNFFLRKYFLLNPKAKNAAWPRLSNAPNYSFNGSKLAELSSKNRRGYL